ADNIYGQFERATSNGEYTPEQWVDYYISNGLNGVISEMGNNVGTQIYESIFGKEGMQQDIPGTTVNE
ncbi:MAG: hypothetical protein NUV80_03020, partial [Candidatus Berkelbacteria bacterium]|nr:hypothetical protein [Candidatus Berkelbacteria bacterium]